MINKILFIGYGTITKGIINNILNKSSIKISIWSKHTSIENEKFICSSNLIKIIDNTDFIICCVPDDEASREVWSNQIIKDYIRKHRVYCMEISTLSYDYIKTWHNYIKSISGKPIESPLTGSREGANNGSLSLFIYTEYINQIKDFLLLFSHCIYEFKSEGDPTKFKLIYNFWGAAMIWQLSELYVIINKEFHCNELVWKILETNGWMSAVCKNIIPKVKENKFNDVRFKLKYMKKDVSYSKKFLEQSPLFGYVNDFYEEKVCKDNENLDYSVIVKEV